MLFIVVSSILKLFHFLLRLHKNFIANFVLLSVFSSDALVFGLFTLIDV